VLPKEAATGRLEILNPSGCKFGDMMAPRSLPAD
jgi:hypothetical protein